MNMTDSKTTYHSPLGLMTLASNGQHLTGLWLANQAHFAETLTDDAVTNDTLQVFIDTKNWLASYFSGHQPTIAALPLAPAGSSFRQAVWQILCEIPYGELITYGEIAKKLAITLEKVSMSSQAVGGAVGHNPISIIIPCHRVIGANGSLTGYAGGMDAKVSLLRLEGVDMTTVFIP
ncbi:methylated-DNA--[protein]-cysteine S-methyltransferase [Lactococcus paracarnosus]|nr:Methylated-DNA--protein-cysteine methyltransferase [Lactococcus piscium]